MSVLSDTLGGRGRRLSLSRLALVLRHALSQPAIGEDHGTTATGVQYVIYTGRMNSDRVLVSFYTAPWTPIHARDYYAGFSVPAIIYEDRTQNKPKRRRKKKNRTTENAQLTPRRQVSFQHHKSHAGRLLFVRVRTRGSSPRLRPGGSCPCCSYQGPHRGRTRPLAGCCSSGTRWAGCKAPCRPPRARSWCSAFPCATCGR